jgi:hypothetical protein
MHNWRAKQVEKNQKTKKQKQKQKPKMVLDLAVG